MIKKVVITGGCGYIGSHIAKALKLAGYQVTIIDWIRREHTLKYCDYFYNIDYGSDAMYYHLKYNPPDAIIHCAGSIVVGESVVSPALYYNNNVAKTARFLDWVQQLDEQPGVKQLPVIVFSSSAAVYGNPAPHQIPVTEECPIKPASPYGHSKAIIEQMLSDFDHAYGMKSVCLRYFNACGSDPFGHTLGQASGATHIIAQLMESKLNNTIFTLNGVDFNTPDGTCIRDYIHVWDLAIAHVAALDYLFAGGKSVNLNLGTNTGLSNREIINQVCRTVGEIAIKEGPRRKGDPDILIADATKAQNLINWNPNYSSLENIVESAWAWYTSI